MLLFFFQRVTADTEAHVFVVHTRRVVLSHKLRVGTSGVLTLVLTRETEHLLGIIFYLSGLVILQCVWRRKKNTLNPTRSANCSEEIHDLM